jgi:hypothetical protein
VSFEIICRYAASHFKDAGFCLPSARMNQLDIGRVAEFPGMGGSEDQSQIFVDFNEMLAASQCVEFRRAVSSREKASCISPCNEGFNLSVGADFPGKPRTLRLCCTNFT